MKVLVVDDTAMMRAEISTIIKILGHEVVQVAKDGEEAITAYKKHSPDLVTMDINMPNMSGIMALGHILKIDPKAKVIMATTNGLESWVVKSIQAGALGYILKPTTVSAVKEAIDKVFSEDAKYLEGELFRGME